MHDLTLVITLAAALAVALVLGGLTQRLGLSTLVGYMAAGILVGPNTPGFVADQALASQLAEIGVVLLMFGVGMHFHPRELLRVWRIALPGAVAQSAVAALAGWALARSFGWSNAAGLIFGMALAVASTVVLTRMLVERQRLSSRDGHVAIGWLIVEDLFTVVALVVLPVVAAGGADATPTAEHGSLVALALAKVLLFALLVLVLGSRLAHRLLEGTAAAGGGAPGGELFTLAVFVIALGVAALAAEVFHVSVALGAFFAGLVVGQSRFGPQAAVEIGAFRDVFTALFFVSVGMLFDPSFVLREPMMVLAVLAIVMLLKPAIAVLIVLLMRDTPRTAATVGVGLAQIGEFSFILASLGLGMGVLPREAFDALVVAAIVSIALNPLLFRWVEKLLPAERLATADDEAAPASSLAPSALGGATPVLLVGGGALGGRVLRRLAGAGVPLTLLRPQAAGALDALPAGVSQLIGDVADPKLLEAAGVRQARLMVLADGTLAEKMRVCGSARELNPWLAIVGAASHDAEAAWLRDFGVDDVCDALDQQAEQVARAVRARL
ncbi:cation:proton antiporter [Rivibacter subsaxonicus]|uniref:Kef-type potassium/proton antiporter (CPA2 family) n=1 Tax=Rivibacter subsaxonicus TaxID=457575 RepID=A0A4Q7W2Z1_9BURK|nr:cation:proton antiporter [Rivibacter subsaxonicus]RZU03159.1 Kef-type potassium/proton antiporter (CPA2 family) [Rivibacter subsaxonicus]